MSENTGIDASAQAKEWQITLYGKDFESAAPLESDSDTLESNATKIKNVVPLSKRRKHYGKVLCLVTWEAIILISVALFTIWSDQTFKLLHCPYVFHVCLCQNAMLITGFLTIICNFLAIYGLWKWKVGYLSFGIYHRKIAGLFFHLYIFSIFFGGLKVSGPLVIFLIGLYIYLDNVNDVIKKQVDYMLDYPQDPNPNNQLF